MLRHRSDGLSFVKIGEMFNKHHSTVIHWCKRFNVTIGSAIPEPWELDSKINKKPIPNQYKYRDLIEEPINLGKKNYAAYLREKGITIPPRPMSYEEESHDHLYYFG
jgi:hypothetical protein